ncbi:hypothetical protein [Mariniplasma anaerobium]|uniref:UDP-phosphate galactose phosphotransferase n=1 Tax=Mariniplasma anaerobium TaxID=2735436 RepID=A0A7U9THA9_9MOLU|nr:hypothetical protein [Mariniplasma anaerobium]BCR36293.1 hypothetical protein MPAN_011860 [Mariniplasma anaerobium]
MKSYKSFIVLCLDIFVIFVGFTMALFLKDEFVFYPEDFLSLLKKFPFIIFTYLILFYFLGMYKSVWKYVSFE